MTEPETGAKPVDPGRSSIVRNIKQLLPYLAQFKFKVWVICIGSFIFGAVRLVEPNLYRVIIDEAWNKLSQGTISEQAAFRIVGHSGGIILAVYIAAALLYAWYAYLSMELTQRMEARMMRDAVQHLHSLDMAVHQSWNSGEVLSRVERGIDSATSVLHGTVAKVMLPSLVNIACLLVMMFWQNWRLALAAIALLPIHIVLSLKKSREIHREQSGINKLYEKIYHRVYEGIWNIEAVTDFNAAEHELALFDKDRADALERQLKIARWWRILGFSTGFFNKVGMLSIFSVGTYLLARHQATLGELVMYMTLVAMLYQPAFDVITGYVEAQVHLSKINRLFDLLRIKAKVQELPGAIQMPAVRLGIRLNGVSFSYDKMGALHDLDLMIPAGQKIAIVGPSGAGKSTLAHLLLRHFDPSAGTITVDGTDLRLFTLKSVHDRITHVSQHAQLFSRTVDENIAYGIPDAPVEKIRAAAMVANAHEFIEQKEHGYGTMIGEKGVKLSGGQQQRVAIARAVLHDASVIILDEATSHLDSYAESLVQEALWKLIAGKTAVMIAHRLSTVLNSDIIVVLDQGRIVDTGTHAELLGRCELYTKLCGLQFKDSQVMTTGK